MYIETHVERGVFLILNQFTQKSVRTKIYCTTTYLYQFN